MVHHKHVEELETLQDSESKPDGIDESGSLEGLLVNSIEKLQYVIVEAAGL